MFDIKSVEEEARKELPEERGKAAKGKIKDSLKRIAAAEAIVRNLRDEHTVLLAEIGE
jgi:hypothetical protein